MTQENNLPPAADNPSAEAELEARAKKRAEREERDRAVAFARLCDKARAAYERFIVQKAVRARPTVPLTFDELGSDERDAWIAAVSE